MKKPSVQPVQSAQSTQPSSASAATAPPKQVHAMSRSLLDEIRNTRVGEESEFEHRKSRFFERL